MAARQGNSRVGGTGWLQGRVTIDGYAGVCVRRERERERERLSAIFN